MFDPDIIGKKVKFEADVVGYDGEVVRNYTGGFSTKEKTGTLLGVSDKGRSRTFRRGHEVISEESAFAFIVKEDGTNESHEVGKVIFIEENQDGKQ